MKQLVLPLALVALLSFGLLAIVFNQRRTRPPAPVPPPAAAESGETPAPRASEAAVAEKLRVAEEALKAGKFDDAYAALEGLAGEDDERVQGLLGEIQVGRGRAAEAVPFLEKAVAQKKDSRLQLLLAESFLAAGKPELAGKLFGEMAKVHQASSVRERVLLGRAQAASASREFGMALEFLKGLTREFPGSATGSVETLKLLHQMKPKDLGDELHALREVGDQRHSALFEYQLWLGLCYWLAGNKGEAAVHLRKASAQRPAEVSLHQMLYQMAREAGQGTEALERLLAWQDALPEGAPPPVQADALFQAALEAKEAGRPDLAFRFLRSSVLVDKSLLGRDDQGTLQAVAEHVEGKGSAEEKAFMKAFQAYFLGEHQKARSTMEPVLPKITDRRLKRDAEILLADVQKILLGDAAYAKYQAEQEAARQKAILASQTAAAAAASATARQAQVLQSASGTRGPVGGQAEKIAKVKEKLAKAPDNTAVQYEGGRQLFILGDREGAKAAFGNALKATPGLWEARHCLALIAIAERKPAEASVQLEEAIRINPDSALLRGLLGSVKLQLGDFAGAIEQSQKALEIDPQNGQAHLVLADIYYRSKRDDDAMDMINKGLAVETDPKIIENLEALKRKVQGP